MFEMINGLPGHVLLVHAVIVLTPLACLCLVASAAWPVARARLGVVTPTLALIALILVPITTNAGEWLRDHLGFTNAAIRKHTELGDSLLPWAIGVFVLSAAVWVGSRYYDLSWRPSATEPDPHNSGSAAVAIRTRTVLPVWVTAVIVIVCVAVSIGTMITLYRIGDSGAHAVWNGIGQK